MIRREAFGGIVFHEPSHKIFTLDRESFRLIELVFINQSDASTIQSDLRYQFGRAVSLREIRNFATQTRKKLGPSLLSQRGRTDSGIWENDWHGQYFSAPISNYWSFTNLCNLRCEHCAWNSQKPLPNELDTAQCLGLIDQMFDMGVCELSFSGGEPLTKKKQLLAMASYGSQLGFHLGLATNAIMINNEVADELLHAGLNEVQVSFEGIEAHEKIRGRGVLKKTFEGIKILLAKGFDITFSVTVNKTNLGELDNILSSARTLGVKQVRFVRFVPIGRGKNNLQMFELSNAEELALARSLWKKRWELFPDTVVTFNKHYVSIGVHDQPELGQIPPTFGWNWDCPSGRSRICIMPQGKVAPCPLIGSLGLSGGDLTRTPLKTIWENSPFFQYVRKDKREHNSKCASCALWDKCSGGCKAASYACTSDLMAPDPLCLQESFDPILERG